MYDINKSHETLNICFKECIFTINSCKELFVGHQVSGQELKDFSNY
jgi:hypothetical protein